MNNKLYLECYSGISGDMTVAALIDLGASEKVLREALDSIPVQGFKIEISRVKKNGLDACDFDVILDHPSHHDHHHHEHRNLEDIKKIIEKTNITDHSKEIANNIFNIIAISEAKVHGLNIDEVHFHEVGAIDSIVDIIAVAVCIDNLNISEVIVSEMYEGKGFINCQHGLIPIPVPAVSNIAAKYNLHLHLTEIEGELITPTGAAIVAALRTSNQLPEKYSIINIGMGAGKREYKTPGILRAMLINELK